MEISSHGIVQNRIKNIPFTIAIFTNLTQDHLDFHKNMKKYEQSKWSFLHTYNIDKIILNTNDKIGKIWLKKLFNHYTISVTIQDNKQKQYSTKWINAIYINININQIHVKFESSWGNGEFISTLMGYFNVMNILLTLASFLELGYDLSLLTNTAKKLQPVLGRMQTFNIPTKPIFIVDYAHTPDALKNSLKTIKLYYKTHKIWCIFGCGGERDRKKRPLMREIAEIFCNHIIITNDNPRGESEIQIINDILKGCTKKEKIFIIKNRKKAISFAFYQAKSTDIIFIAGKGHEKKQIVRNKSINYSDIRTVLNLLGKI